MMDLKHRLRLNIEWLLTMYDDLMTWIERAERKIYKHTEYDWVSLHASVGLFTIYEQLRLSLSFVTNELKVAMYKDLMMYRETHNEHAIHSDITKY